ncbi:unnamed protein product [Urochloa decumbens]|uniref:Uncharacterized protein n=1 Tax=Urochloa decumbens TaxID=240449 RepID=A0ABC9AQN2_9POAL
MESQDSVPLQSDDVQRGSPENRSTRRLHTGQQLVNRMPSNPKIAVFESTQERFEVPLRPDLRSTYPVGGGPGSSFQQQPNPNVCQTSYVRRARNASDDRTGVGVRRRKKQRSSHHSSKENNSAPDNSRRLTDYFLFKIRSSTCYDAVDVRNVGFDDMTDVPMFHLPRMRDLLSRPLGCLTGRPLQAFLGFFEQFDQTLSENTRAIQASLCNIAKAPYRLAEKCGPVLEELIAAQSSSPDPNVIGETSRRNNSVIEEDIVDAHNGIGQSHEQPVAVSLNDYD